MSALVRFGPTARFKTGRILLLIAAALMTLNHFVGIFVLGEPVLFTGFTAFTLYALLVIYFPFRRAEPWAWYTTWILPVGLAVPASSDANLALLYYTVAAVCVVGLLLTRQDFSTRS